MSHDTQNDNPSPAFSIEEVRTTHKWFDMSVAELRRQFARSRFRGHVTFTNDKARVSQGMGVWKWSEFGANRTPYVSLTVLDQPTTRHHGVHTQEAALAHMLVHVEAGTQCSSAEPQDWDDAECEIELEAMQRMDWSSWNCDKWVPAISGFVEYIPVAERALSSTRAAGAGVSGDSPEGPAWDGFGHADLHRLFMLSRYCGRVIFTDHPSEVLGDGFGSWKWSKVGPSSEPYVLLVMLDQPTTKHHGMRTREAVLAHMLVHIEQRSQCQSAEPQNWDDSEREVEFEAMRRMGWAAGLCDKWDPVLRETVPYVHGAC